MSNWQNFLAMGGYGFYVWTAYGISAITLLLNVWLPSAREKRLLRELGSRASDSIAQ